MIIEKNHKFLLSSPERLWLHIVNVFHISKLIYNYYLATVGVHNAQICSIVRALYMSPCGGSARYVDRDGWPDGVPVVAVKPPDFPHHASPGGRERLVGRSAADVGGT